MTTSQIQLREAWNEISFPDDCPPECPYLLETTDGFGTGDSPTSYECTCKKPEGCPAVRELLRNHGGNS